MVGLPRPSHPSATTPPGVLGLAADGAPADPETVEDDGLAGWWEDGITSVDADDEWLDGHFGAAPLGIP